MCECKYVCESESECLSLSLCLFVAFTRAPFHPYMYTCKQGKENECLPELWSGYRLVHSNQMYIQVRQITDPSKCGYNHREDTGYSYRLRTMCVLMRAYERDDVCERECVHLDEKEGMNECGQALERR